MDLTQKPHKILVVDDEDVVTEIAAKRLTKAGYDVATASNGVEALVCIDKDMPDLIVLDIEMPKMNGYIFLTELKRKEDIATLPPIIIVSAYQQMEAIFRRNGVVDYLTKPLRLSDLITKVKAVLGD